MKRRHRGERAELVCEHGRASRGVEQETEQTYQEAMQKGIQFGREDQGAIAKEGMRQTEGLSISIDRHGRDLRIHRVDELNVERGRDGPDR